MPVVEAARRATEVLARLTGREVDGVSAVVATEDGDGWRVTVEVVEVARVPESTSLLGTYETELDGDGNVVSYERTRRYHRNQAD
jgi:hypothetical protein